MNLPYLRATYYEFIAMILDTQGNMNFEGERCGLSLGSHRGRR